ncbi:MAG: cupin domain-containing protein [Bacteroidaceae bacterium]|nr:cupin domain-containing protein [Bacteroidaceae bacterium]
MLIDFNGISETINPNFKGGNKSVGTRGFSDGANKIVRLRLEPGSSIGSHTHQSNSEIMMILKGKGHIIYDGSEFDIAEGQCHYCPKGHTHSLINDSGSDIEVFAVIPEQ